MQSLFLFLVAGASLSFGGKPSPPPVKSEFPIQGVLVPGYEAVTDEAVADYYGGKTFLYFPDLLMTWMPAHSYCRRHGMRLPVYSTREEFDFLSSFLFSVHKWRGNERGITWIGANDIQNKTNFVNFYTGRPFTKFYNNGPNDTASLSQTHDERCVELIARLDDVPVINDVTCTWKRNVVCTFGTLDVPKGSKCTILGQCENEEEVIPLVPDKLDDSIISICPGSTRWVEMSFEVARIPLDVYILMDNSGTMYDDLDNVDRFSSKLVAQIAKLSADHTIGFGVFIDKPKPFGSGDENSYSFSNIVSLTANKTDFLDGVRKVVDSPDVITGGDDPEGQLDAMYQVAACKEQIGWRPFARHLLVFLTDDVYHVAGDGAEYKLVPFEGGCFVNSEGAYTQQNVYDFPTLDQIKDIFTEHQIIPIFGVTENAIDFYQSLADKINPSAITTLSADSSNLISVIEDNYHGIQRKAEIELANEVTPMLEFKYFTDCGTGGEEKEAMVCDDIGRAESVKFKVGITLKQCESAVGLDYMEKVMFRLKGLPSEAGVDVRIHCKYAERVEEVKS